MADTNLLYMMKRKIIIHLMPTLEINDWIIILLIKDKVTKEQI